MIPFLALFLIGSIIVPLGDMVHVLTLTTSYPPEQLERSIFGIIPWWVPFLFGFAGVFSGIHTLLVRQRFPRIRSSKPAEWITGMIAFLGMYFLSGLLPKNWSNDVALAVCGLVLFLFVGDKSKGAVLQALGIVIGGTAFEAMLVHFGVFSYSDLHNELFGVAPWLPWLYVGVAVSVDSFLKWWGDKVKP